MRPVTPRSMSEKVIQNYCFAVQLNAHQYSGIRLVEFEIASITSCFCAKPMIYMLFFNNRICKLTCRRHL